jgi:hypothetical protein
MIGSSIQMLELAIGIKDSLTAAGFTSLDSLVSSNPTNIAAVLGIELYVARLIIDAARRAYGQQKAEDTSLIELSSE